MLDGGPSHSIAARIGRTVELRRDAPAVLFDECTVSYAALYEDACGIAAGLLEVGIEPGDRVVLGLGNSPTLVASILGILRCGAILVPVNPAATADEVGYVVQDAHARLAILEPAQADALMALQLRELRICTPDATPRTAFAVKNFPTRDAALPALIIYTSGTTGRPKGAVLSHHALATNLLSVADVWRWTAVDRLLLTLPCFHLHGLGLGILTSLMVGSSIVLRRRFVVEDVLADLARFQCTMFFGVPTMYNRLVGLPAAAVEAADLRRVRLWVSGSAPLTAATFEKFQERFGYALMDRYGMTECCFVLSTPYAEARRPGVVGRPIPGVEVRLVDPEAADDGRIEDVAGGVHGEILVRGPNLFSGYWNRPDETRRAMLGDYLRSGDIAIREPDGMFRIVGRRSVDIIKSRGFKVGAVEIEEALLRHPAVEEAAVVGLPDADQGERIVAAVTLRGDGCASEDELRAHVRQLLAPHKVPARIYFLTEIPRIGPGKFQKKALIAQLRGVS